MVGVWVHVDRNAGTSGNAGRCCSGVELVAADVATGHVTNEAIVLPVLGFADSRPSCITVDDRKCVCKSLVKVDYADRCTSQALQ